MQEQIVYDKGAPEGVRSESFDDVEYGDGSLGPDDIAISVRANGVNPVDAKYCWEISCRNFYPKLSSGLWSTGVAQGLTLVAS